MTGIIRHEDRDHDLTPERPFVARRVFISYGHDEHVSLAIRLRDDLRSRGHNLWFDEERLQPGHDWETFIEEGLKQLAVPAHKATSAVLLLLTPHSVRRPDGYCLNEVARALALGLRIIPLMVVESEPPLSIYRIQWLDMRECIPINQKEVFYAPKLARILKALEENQLDFEGVQSQIMASLNPIEFSADILKLLRDFTGRKWVFDEVDAWLGNPHGSKVFWITGAPGVGKSAIAAWLRDNRREIAAFHFCDINSEEKRDPAKLVRSIVYQLSTQLPEYMDRLGRRPLDKIVREYREAQTLFDNLLIQPLAEDFPPPDRAVVVLIDALDEATSQRRNEIVRFLALHADKTPVWLRFLVTSRPEPEIVSSLKRLSPYVLDTSSVKRLSPYVLDTAKAENLRDLRAYLRAQIPSITPDQTEFILKRSEGVFLYVRHVRDAIRDGYLSLQNLDAFPVGLGAAYQQFFDRQFGGDMTFYEEKITPLLQPVLAAFEPLTLGFLRRHREVSDTEFERILNRLGSLFPASGETDGDTIRPFHRSVCDWITRRESAVHYVIAVSDGHRVLADQGWKQYEQGPEAMDSYFLQWLPSHLLALGDDKRVVRLLKDFRYGMERTRRGMLDRMLTDFRQLPERLTAQREKLEIEAAFFRERAHILRRGNAEWPAHKILLQLAVEHADDSPLTEGAEQWLEEGRCDWLWLRRVPRLAHAQKNRCLGVLEGHTHYVIGALVLSDGRLLSWSWDETLRMWDGQSGAFLTVLEGHANRVSGALVLSNGRLLSWGDNTLRLWDGQNGAFLAVLEGHTDSVQGALELSDGRLLSWAWDHTLRLWDEESGTCPTVLEGHTSSVQGALVLSDGRLLSWGDNTLRLWDGQGGTCLAVLAGHTNLVRGARMLSDGRLVSWSNDKTLRLWDGQSGVCLEVMEGHTDSVLGALVLSNGRLVSWGDKTLRLWDGESGTCLAVLKGHTDSVQGALVLSNGRLVSWSNDKTLRLWGGQSGACLAVLKGHTEGVGGALALSDGRLVSWAGGISSRDTVLRLWDGESGACLAVLEGHTKHVKGALALSEGRLLSWSADETLRLWDGQSGVCRTVLEGHTHWVWGVQALSNGRLVSWSNDKTLRLWDGQSGACLTVIEGHTDSVQGALALSNGRLVSWGDNTLRLWDGESGACLAVLEGHTDSVQGALALSDGRLLSWGDNTLRLWDEESGTCLTVLKGHTGSVDGALALADGRLLSWSADHTLRLWDGQSGVCQKVLEGHSAGVTSALELADGRLLSWSWSNEKTLRLWDGESGACLAVLEGHTNRVSGALMLSDGRLLSWADSTLRLWDGQSGTCLAVLEGHTKYVKGALALSDGRLLSWSADEMLRLWDGQSGECLEVAPEDSVAHRHPEWLWLREKIRNPESVCRDFFVCASSRLLELRLKTLAAPLATWNAESDVGAPCLLQNGTVVVTQDNGQVCILKLYDGQDRVSPGEVEGRGLSP